MTRYGYYRVHGINYIASYCRNSYEMWKNYEPETIERKVLDCALKFPAHGQTWTANELKRFGLQISPGGVRSIWMRHQLQVKALRLKRFEKWAANNEN